MAAALLTFLTFCKECTKTYWKYKPLFRMDMILRKLPLNAAQQNIPKAQLGWDIGLTAVNTGSSE